MFPSSSFDMRTNLPKDVQSFARRTPQESAWGARAIRARAGRKGDQNHDRRCDGSEGLLDGGPGRRGVLTWRKRFVFDKVSIWGSISRCPQEDEQERKTQR